MPGVAHLVATSAPRARRTAARHEGMLPRAAIAPLPSLRYTVIRPPRGSPRVGEQQDQLDDLRRIIDRATFGWTPVLDLEVRSLGIEAWLDQQLDPGGTSTPALEAMLAPYDAQENPGGYQMLHGSNLSNHPWTGVDTFGEAAARETRSRYEIRHATLLRAVHSRRQLYEVMVDFWSNHFNVYTDGSFYQRHLKCKNDRTVARAHALGRFADLLQASAHDTQMLIYLDNWRSEADQQAGPDDPPGVNENYGRELIELHTLGIINGEHVYTEDDVVAAAKILSGWSIQLPSDAPFDQPGEWEFVFRSASHWRHPVTFLAHLDPAEQLQTSGAGGTAGYQEGVAFLDFLAHHPSTARYLAYKLCKRFIADEPPMPLVEHLAGVYLAEDTAIAPVLRELLTSDELQAAAPRVRRGFEAVVFTLRASRCEIDPRPRGDSFAGASTYLHEPQTGVLAGLGHHLFGRPSPDGYPEATDEWLSSDGMLRRWTFAADLANNTANQGLEVDAAVLGPLGLDRTAGALVDQVACRLLGRATPLASASFTDVTISHPFVVDISWMASEGISTGYADGTFRSGAAVSRQAMSAFLHRLIDPDPPFVPPEEATFSDVAPSNQFFADVEWMAEQGISTGYADGTFRPGAPVSRQAMSAFLHRLADPDGLFVPPEEATFSDVAPSNQFFADVEWMATVGVSAGYADGTFRPGTPVSRQAMSAFLHRFAPPPPSMLPAEERDAIVAALGGDDLLVPFEQMADAQADVVGLVLSTPTAVRR